jgi:hypothetical protein
VDPALATAFFGEPSLPGLIALLQRGRATGSCAPLVALPRPSSQ